MKCLRLVSVFLFIFLFTATLAGIGSAQESATKEECIKMTKAAGDMVKKKGLDAALVAINDKNGPFVWKDTYVFCINMESQTVVGHPIKPGLIGKNLMGIKDVNGKMFFSEFVNVAKNKGEGWVDYMWPKPNEKKPSPKVSYIYRVPGEDLLMAAGTYE
ncbi:MAG: sodium:calcium antiporter [Desulfobacteraceae bacterium]|nr:sodium:calcium antiporter [Desulfobacteraceae bacterium]